MKNIKQNIKIILPTLIIGIFLGWLFFHESGNKSEGTHKHKTETIAQEVDYTCSMHPQIKQNKFGLCPICAMDLVPMTSMESSDDEASAYEIQMTESAMKLAAIQTTIIQRGMPEKDVYLLGKVKPDERNIAELTARFGGRIEKLFVNYVGQHVKKGERLGTIYSPELVSAQVELIESSLYKDSNPALYNASKSKLKLWDLNDWQINNIEKKGKPTLYFDILSPISGTVSKRHVSHGDYVEVGSALFEVIDLTKIWVMFDAYENDLLWIKTGDQVDFTIQSLPGHTFSGNVSYIDPFINPTTRVTNIRIEMENPDLIFKPEMFANGILQSSIAGDTDELLIPKSAILWTGKRAIVYLKVQDREIPTFLHREIILGPEAGNFYVISNGLEEGDEIAINGVFKIDAAAQLAGKPSMMNPDVGIGSLGHQHGAIELTDNADEVFTVYGNCSMCKERIENAANIVKGVQQVQWDEQTKLLHLKLGEDVDIAEIHKNIAIEGHDTDQETASNEVYENLHRCCKYLRPADLTIQEFRVYGNCQMCKERIETAAYDPEGVLKAEWGQETKNLKLKFNPEIVSQTEVEQAIAKVGHDTDNYRASDEVYSDLHECCLYDRPEKK